jgi:hypothetical protein
MRGFLVLVVVAFFIASGTMLAHHGAAAAFDTGKNVKVQGTITDFQFTNPHVLVYFECKNDKGEKEQWQGELTAPTKLGRAGWTKTTLKPGDPVTVGGYPARSGAHTLWIRELIGPDGKSLPLFEE